MDEHNPAFTGFFRDGPQKRIDLVLVIADGDSYITEEMRINYLKNVIKFGLELELEEGKMFEHRTLIFVKVHAPDSIIEEYGLYFNVRKFFKDIHVDHVNVLINPLGVKHERELIKHIRNQYPGPGNYSTLERSKIVYNIVHRIPFGQHKELFGINQLLELNIIHDVFALHDGPYFLTSGQSTYMNGRQTLFYYWTGVKNIFTAQPIHMIQEYLGERVAMYFAYYEYFNCMLLFPALVGFLVTWQHYYGDVPELDKYYKRLCGDEVMEEKLYGFCPQCRHFGLCPIRKIWSYCKELLFLRTIDTHYMRTFAFLVSIWGIVFAVMWNRKHNTLTWMWEVKEKYINNIINPEYYSPRQFHASRVTRLMLLFKSGFLSYAMSAALFGFWVFVIFVLSTQIWYIKFWLDKKYNKPFVWNDYGRYSELLFIGVEAGVYSVLTTAIKPVAKILSHKLTALENNKTLGLYSCSLAIKLYGFYFTGTFALLTLHLFVGNVFYTHLLDMQNWYSIGGFKVMHNGFGTSLDDICVTLGVAVVIEQVIVKFPLYFQRKASEYEVLNKNAPIWEREYKLDTLKDDYFHNEYNNIAIQFAMATLFSLTFPVAPLLILVINIWDIRHKARSLTLTYRRPVLLNTSGPAIWHKIIVFTSYFVPITNICTIAFQSRQFILDHAFKTTGMDSAVFYDVHYYIGIGRHTFDIFKGPGSPSEEIKKLPEDHCNKLIHDHWFHRSKNEFFQEYQATHTRNYKYLYIILYSMIGILINMFIHFEFPTHSSDIEDTVRIESRIKQKYYIKKGFLPNDE